MSFSIKLEKNEDGVLVITSQMAPEMCPDKLRIDGHVEGDQVVDLSVRVDNLYASVSRRVGPVY